MPSHMGVYYPWYAGIVFTLLGVCGCQYKSLF